jgi:hypothetical protein
MIAAGGWAPSFVFSFQAVGNVMQTSTPWKGRRSSQTRAMANAREACLDPNAFAICKNPSGTDAPCTLACAGAGVTHGPDCLKRDTFIRFFERKCMKNDGKQRFFKRKCMKKHAQPLPKKTLNQSVGKNISGRVQSSVPDALAPLRGPFACDWRCVMHRHPRARRLALRPGALKMPCVGALPT